MVTQCRNLAEWNLLQFTLLGIEVGLPGTTGLVFPSFGKERLTNLYVAFMWGCRRRVRSSENFAVGGGLALDSGAFPLRNSGGRVKRFDCPLSGK